MPQRDPHGADHRDLRQQADELGDARKFVLAVLVTQMDVFNRLLGTTQINLRQFGWALIPALALLVLWELGKYVARRRMSNRPGSAGPETTQVAGA